MSDIVERLRDPKVYIPGEELLHEAADEITRLRNELHLAQEWSARVIDGQEQDITEITRLRAEVEQAQMREACAADLAREWEHHCKRAEAEVEKLKAALTLSDAIWPLAYRDVKASDAKDFSDETLKAWRAYDMARAGTKDAEPVAPLDAELAAVWEANTDKLYEP